MQYLSARQKWFLGVEDFRQVYCMLHFPGGSDGKASVYNAGNLGSIPGLGRSPGEGNGNPLQDYCLENPMNRGAWQATAHGVAKSRTRLSDFTSLHLQLPESVSYYLCEHNGEVMKIIKHQPMPHPKIIHRFCSSLGQQEGRRKHTRPQGEKGLRQTIICCYTFKGASQVTLVVKNLPTDRDIRATGQILRLGRSPGKGHGDPLHQSCWENPIGSHRVRHN